MSLIRPLYEAGQRPLKRLIARLAPIADTLIYAGGITENLLVRSLLFVYKSKFRKDWMYSSAPPHYTDFRVMSAYFAFGHPVFGPYSFYRGFFNSELIQQNDVLLDIGCGDGFFSSRFFAEKCAHVDALDIDANAIRDARKYNPASNVSFHLLNAVTDPFPQTGYDLVVWDGAIGHFPSDDIDQMLRKIVRCLNPGGIFAGSESLGVEGYDHLQFFEKAEDLGRLFQPYFKYVRLKTVQYKLRQSDFIRTEAFWRCSNSEQRLAAGEWTPLPN
ncbi:MAG: class I SAM-dependent methyltransferase [Anaerolineales bacterium]|nr:class I SAM-dependent methyltransferase [Anaerolineales bacterium]